MGCLRYWQVHNLVLVLILLAGAPYQVELVGILPGCQSYGHDQDAWDMSASSQVISQVPRMLARFRVTNRQ